MVDGFTNDFPTFPLDRSFQKGAMFSDMVALAVLPTLILKREGTNRADVVEEAYLFAGQMLIEREKWKPTSSTQAVDCSYCDGG